MSGIEVAGLVFGVLPVVVEAIKAWRVAAEKIRIFRHYSKEVRRIRTQFQVLNQIFLNECRLLLQHVVKDEDTTDNMLDDTGHSFWRDKALNDELKKFLNSSFEAYKCAIEDTQTILEEVWQDLKCFDVMIPYKAKGETLKDTIRRVRQSLKISFEKYRFERNLAGLRDRNADLQLLSSQVKRLEEHHSSSDVPGSCIVQDRLISQFSAIQRVSHKLHEALTASWYCGDGAHTKHCARLCLDVDVGQTVRLELAISYYKKLLTETQSPCIVKPPIWLHVQSISFDNMTTTTPVPSALPANDPGPIRTVTTERKALVINHWDDDDTGSSTSQRHGDRATKRRKLLPASCPSGIVDLRKTKSICKHLEQTVFTPGSERLDCCIGYLETPNFFRHIFYSAHTQRNYGGSVQGTVAEVARSLDELLKESSDEFMSIVDQLKLAHRTAMTVLQFHSTPWLSQNWRLRDLYFFGPRRIPEPNDPAEEIAMEGVQATGPVQATPDPYDAYVQYGVNNMTLFGLGVALLEIGHWKPLQGLRRGIDNEIVTARRLAGCQTSLGPKYQDIVRKCLQCNFGCDTDLSKAALQSAVYGDVVRQLEKMMDALTI